MFGLSFGEILIILVVGLLVLGPSGMPKLARTLGKGLRDFRKATGDLRGAFEDEFYKLDQEVKRPHGAPAQQQQGAEPAAGVDAPPPAPDAANEAGREVPEGTIAAAAPEGTVPAPAPHGPRAAPEGTVPAAAPAAGNVATGNLPGAEPQRAQQEAAPTPSARPDETR